MGDGSLSLVSCFGFFRSYGYKCLEGDDDTSLDALSMIEAPQFGVYGCSGVSIGVYKGDLKKPA